MELLTEKEKTYEAVLRLGVSTDTQDMTGAVLSEKPVTVTEEEVREAVGSFVGEQLQIPPMYSALKVNGKKLYELAREGKTIERKPRPVVFYEIRILDMELPLVRISVTCSKGTYIRTLCNDIGEKLGCGGAMEELLRTQVRKFHSGREHDTFPGGGGGCRWDHRGKACFHRGCTFHVSGPYLYTGGRQTSQ